MNVIENIEQLKTATMGVTINKESTTKEPPPWNGQQPKLPVCVCVGGGLNEFNWYQTIALDAAVVEIQEIFSSYGNLLTIAMYQHGETH